MSSGPRGWAAELVDRPPLQQHVPGFRPRRRATLVSVKVAKPIDAPSGLFQEEGRELFEERPNSQGSHKGRQMRRASLLGASRQASDQLSAC
ncbi:MAG: hypothetical protein KIT39_17800 [Nitrospirales bacterium]|nr:hypothetical protein [Nitrospirales bacterium]